jgi:transposase
MKNRKWTGQQKLQIVLEGFKEKMSVAQLCTHHGIAQSQYYKWRDQFLKQGATLFDTQPDKKMERMEMKVKQLTRLVGQLTVELKKTENELEWLES